MLLHSYMLEQLVVAADEGRRHQVLLPMQYKKGRRSVPTINLLVEHSRRTWL